MHLQHIVAVYTSNLTIILLYIIVLLTNLILVVIKQSRMKGMRFKIPSLKKNKNMIL